MTPFLPGLSPQEPEILPASPPQQARRPRPVHRDDSLASLPAARATLARLGVTHADWPHQRLLVVQVAPSPSLPRPHRYVFRAREGCCPGADLRPPHGDRPSARREGQRVV